MSAELPHALPGCGSQGIGSGAPGSDPLAGSSVSKAPESRAEAEACPEAGRAPGAWRGRGSALCLPGGQPGQLSQVHIPCLELGGREAALSLRRVPDGGFVLFSVPAEEAAGVQLPEQPPVPHGTR